jgi:sugar-specific transcriptional regulator TrmB
MDQLKTLQKLGLTEYESRAYLALARLGPSTVREIVLESKLPRNKAYEALQKLEDKNKVVSLPVSPKKFKITGIEFFKDEIKEMNNSLNEMAKIIEQPKQEFRDLFWVIKGQKAIQEKLAVENNKVQKEILACNRLSKILYKNLREMEQSIKRGVKVKMICTFDKSKILVYKEWLKTGAEIRVFNEKMFGPLLPRMSVFDGTIARLTIGKPEVNNEDDYITLWTESKAFAQMLRNHFFNMWKNSKPIEKYMK